MNREKTSKERSAEAAERRAMRNIELAKQALRIIQSAKNQLIQIGELKRSLHPLCTQLDEKIEWLIAEDESFAGAAAELWRREHDSRSQAMSSEMPSRNPSED